MAMTRKTRKIITSYLIVAGILVAFSAVMVVVVALVPLGEGVQLGKLAPDFAVPGLTGGTLALSDYRGRPVVVNFFASWCAPCWTELPDFDQAADKYRESGLVVIGVGVQDSKLSIQRMVNGLGLRFPVGLDPSGELGKQYQIPGLPVTVFVDRRGVVRKYWTGPIYWSALEKSIGAIL